MSAISEKQLRRFYFPRWHACAKANDWVMVKGRLLAQAPSVGSGQLSVAEELRRRVWTAAEQLALQGHRSVTADDLRHACAVIALGRYKSSKDFTNAEVDRVVTLFRLLAEADDVGAMMDWNSPERSERKRLLWAIENAAPEAYTARIARDRFGTEVWTELPIDELRQLLVTLKKRTRDWNSPRRHGGHREVISDQSVKKENCPF